MTTTDLVTEITGDLFTLAPPNAVLVQACNTRGSWGAGIAKTFLEQYPNAYTVYANHCKDPPQGRDRLLGTTLLIPPQPGDKGKGHWIACMFTSHDYGRRKGSPESILVATRGALEDLKGQLGGFVEGVGETGDVKGEEGGKVVPGEVWGCRFNSKNFGVKWERSKRIVEEVGLSMVVVEWGG